MVERHLQVLDLQLTLRGPVECVEPIAFAYRRFAVAAAGPATVEVALEPGSPGFVEAGGRRSSLVSGVNPTAQLYQRFLDVVRVRLGAHALLHAAALRERGGGALLLAAPSGHGKSTLALELARRGLGFMGDDYAPLDLQTGEVHPYPRAVGLTADGAERLGVASRPELAAAELMGKRLVDIGELLGEERIVRQPVPLRHVVLLSDALDGEADQPPTAIRLAARAAEAPALDALFEATPGVEVATRESRPATCHWLLRLDPRYQPTADLSQILESERVLFVEKTWKPRPKFDTPPAARRIPRREAAQALGRELLNRRGDGRLLERYGGSLAALFVDLAGALSGADCFRVRVGEHAATAELLEELARAS